MHFYTRRDARFARVDLGEFCIRYCRRKQLASQWRNPREKYKKEDPTLQNNSKKRRHMLAAAPLTWRTRFASFGRVHVSLSHCFSRLLRRNRTMSDDNTRNSVDILCEGGAARFLLLALIVRHDGYSPRGNMKTGWQSGISKITRAFKTNA